MDRGEDIGLVLKIPKFFCLSGHSICYKPWNITLHKVEGKFDANEKQVYEREMYCFGCDRRYMERELKRE